jgi:Flp pilus assembly protein TadB
MRGNIILIFALLSLLSVFYVYLLYVKNPAVMIPAILMISLLFILGVRQCSVKELKKCRNDLSEVSGNE